MAEQNDPRSPVNDDDRDDGKPQEGSRRYTIYLIVIAVAGWALASYDFNLLVVALPAISKDLGLSNTQVGLLVFLVYGFMMTLSLVVGYLMDQWGRKLMWQLALIGAAIFTGLTVFVHAFIPLIIVRGLASGLANSELAISITLVNEQVPAERRGLLYSIVQGGWPLGVLLASGVFLFFQVHLGWAWQTVFLLGVIPLLIVIVGRTWIRPSTRFQEVKEIREAKEEGDEERVDELTERHDVDVEEVEGTTIKQIFSEKGWVRTQLTKTSVVWLVYAAGFVATNTYIVAWLTKFRDFSNGEATALLLVASGIGILFYVLGGALGEKFGRQRVLVVSAALTCAATAGFYFASAVWLIWVLYIVVYQVVNGTWSGTGYAYWAESFPTRVRGTAVGWLGAMFTGGLIIGSAAWTILIGSFGAVTLLVVGAGFALIQFLLSFTLPQIPPGTELEDVIS